MTLDNKFYELTADGILLYLKITPNAKENKILGILDEGFLSYLKIAINAAPEKNKANKELVAFIAGELKISKSLVNLLKGRTAQKKLIKIIQDPKLLEPKIIQLYKS